MWWGLNSRAAAGQSGHPGRRGLTRVLAAASIKPLGLRSLGVRRESDLTLNF